MAWHQTIPKKATFWSELRLCQWSKGQNSCFFVVFLSHSTSTMPAGNRWGPWRSLLVLSPVLIGGPLYAYQQHFSEFQGRLCSDSFLTFSPIPRTTRTSISIVRSRSVWPRCVSHVLTREQDQPGHQTSPDIRRTDPWNIQTSIRRHWLSHSRNV